MNCKKYGKELQEDQQFCSACGTPTPTIQTHDAADVKQTAASVASSLKALGLALFTTARNSAPVRRFMALPTKKKQIAGGAAAGVLALAVLCVCLLGGRSYKKTVDIFVNKGIVHPSGKAIVSLIPDKLFKEAGYNKEDIQDLVDKLDDGFESQQKSLNKALGKNWKVSYTIVEDEPRDEDKLKDIQDDYEDDYDIKVTDARVVKVKLHFKGKENTSATMRVPVVKVGGSWYIDYVSLGGISLKLNF